MLSFSFAADVDPTNQIHTYLQENDLILLCSRMQLQRARPTLPLQHGAVQAVRPSERRRVPQVPALHRRPALPLLPGGVLPGPHQAYHAQEGVQT